MKKKGWGMAEKKYPSLKETDFKISINNNDIKKFHPKFKKGLPLLANVDFISPGENRVWYVYGFLLNPKYRMVSQRKTVLTLTGIASGPNDRPTGLAMIKEDMIFLSNKKETLFIRIYKSELGKLINFLPQEKKGISGFFYNLFKGWYLKLKKIIKIVKKSGGGIFCQECFQKMILAKIKKKKAVFYCKKCHTSAKLSSESEHRLRIQYYFRKEGDMVSFGVMSKEKIIKYFSEKEMLSDD